jgi:hypothetical protein
MIIHINKCIHIEASKQGANMKKLILAAVLSMATHVAYGSAGEAGAGYVPCIPWAKQLRDTGYSDDETHPPEADDEAQQPEVVARAGTTTSVMDTMLRHVVPSRRRAADAQDRAIAVLDNIRCPAPIHSLMMSIMLYQDPAYRCIEPPVTPESGWLRFGFEGVSDRAVHVLGIRARHNGRRTTTEIIISRDHVWMQSTGGSSPMTVLEQQDAELEIDNIDASSVWRLMLIAVNPTTYRMLELPGRVADAHQFVTRAAIQRDGPLVAASNCRAEWYRYTRYWTSAIVWLYDQYLYVPA